MIKQTRGGTLLSQVHQVSGRVWNRILREHDMSDLEGARGRVIFALWGNTGILSRLLRDGYINRESDETDRRSVRILLTGKEQGFLDKIEFVSNEMNSVFYNGFSDEEIIQFDSFLERILINCKNEEK